MAFPSPHSPVDYTVRRRKLSVRINLARTVQYKTLEVLKPSLRIGSHRVQTRRKEEKKEEKNLNDNFVNLVFFSPLFLLISDKNKDFNAVVKVLDRIRLFNII